MGGNRAGKKRKRNWKHKAEKTRIKMLFFKELIKIYLLIIKIHPLRVKRPGAERAKLFLIHILNKILYTKV